MGWVVRIEGNLWQSFAYELPARDAAWVLEAQGKDVTVGPA